VAPRALRPLAACLAACALLVAPGAWAGSAEELPKRLQELASGPTVTPPERKALEDAIAAWLKARRDHFAALVAIAADADPGKTDGAARWTTAVQTARGTLAKTMGDALRNVSTPTEHAKRFRSAVLQEEDRMLEALGKANAGAARDVIVKNQHKVKEMTELLEIKWEGLLDLDGTYDAQEKAAVNDLQQLVREAMHEVARDQATLVSKLVIAKDERKAKRTVAVGLIDAIKLAMRGSIEQLAKTTGRYPQVRKQLQDAMKSERGGVHFLFKDVRKDTDLFLRENQFGQAKAAYEDARQGLDRARSASATAGQKEDVEDLSRAVLDALSRQLSRTESVQNDFMKKHEKKFFGPIGPDIRNALLETGQWVEWERQFQAFDLDTLARRWRDDASGFYSSQLGSISDEDEEFLRGIVREDLERFVKLSDALAREYDETIALLKARQEAARELE
jgi:hypothetical protein